MSLADCETNHHPASLAEFQQQFGQYLRHQKADNADADKAEFDNSEPNHSNSTTAILQRVSQDVPSRIGKLYQSLIFNNLRGFLDQCFPVCQSLIDDEQWLMVCQAFMAQHPCHSPYFTEINQSFVDFLAQPEQLETLNLPAYFAELAHYEWVELLVDIHSDEANTALAQNLKPNEIQLILNPSLQNLHYQWAVHLISSDEQPDSPEDSFFLVFRNEEDKVEFMQVNALTHALIVYIAEISNQNPIIAPIEDLTAVLTSLLQDFAETLGAENSEVLVEFGLPLLKQLIEQGVLQGVQC
ncbi:HvfC family RiPP maturation protein [Psychrobacter sp. I-STPA10]|uniref:HvfC family RiPP maturation protein n=1 Tax=Psychrobacter sp. I-STPA10 TaxID=2585769 RepID=UPI001E4C30AF|nr:putative DNA-binding domain-containing protein [Psychrobacter sp. I-STPA10]